MSVQGKLSYASQDVWVFSATLRENILFGRPYNKAWYNRVVEACALDKVGRCTLAMIDVCIHVQMLMISIQKMC